MESLAQVRAGAADEYSEGSAFCGCLGSELELAQCDWDRAS